MKEREIPSEVNGLCVLKCKMLFSSCGSSVTQGEGPKIFGPRSFSESTLARPQFYSNYIHTYVIQKPCTLLLYFERESRENILQNIRLKNTAVKAVMLCDCFSAEIYISKINLTECSWFPDQHTVNLVVSICICCGLEIPWKTLTVSPS